ncbi:DUF3606 domain-containing protein [Variovorax sp. J22R133]|uniref:DUF3606 domain-containing protein n=1 Tax=Variovorax brevis TaxID=3053503 RepID=UPI002578F50E|nr:DUF3606 domain-containing protein [Variovorax sp. J22R133]MDM0117261.1 DUF3606 domain-containing protein [Variovorax sp. J22R133]
MARATPTHRWEDSLPASINASPKLKCSTENPKASPDTTIAPNATSPDAIDVQSDIALEEWAKRLAVTAAQIKEAVAIVGDRATDVEAHLKGSRRTTNSARVAEAASDSPSRED